MFRILARTYGAASPPGSTRNKLRRSALLGALVTAGMLAFAGNAFAVSGTPINVGTPFDITALQVAVDSTGTAYVVWANDKDLAPTTTDVVQYCVIPAGTKACSHTGTLTPADGASHVDNVQVLVDGSTVVIIADVYGATTTHYEPEQEWQSTDGGAIFSLVDGGLSVANADSGDTSLTSAVVVPGTNTLGYSAQTPGGGPTFSEFPLTSPPECSVFTPCPYALLEPLTNPDQTSNGGGQFASELGTTPGVLGIVSTDNTNGPFACSDATTVPFGTAFVYGTGAQSAGVNDYNISPGTLHSAWTAPLALADCNVEYYAVAGGPSGFGVLEDNDVNGSIVYQRFNQATGSFAGEPYVTINAGQGEQQPAVSQDGAGGVYGTFLLGGGGGPMSLAYSFNGGSSWIGPTTLNPNTDGGASDLTSDVSAGGQGWMTWLDNGSIYVQQFVASDAIPPPAATTVATKQASGATTGVSLSIPAGTVGETDSATISGANAATATGTASYGLFSKSDCASSSEVFAGGTKAVSGGVAGASSPVTAALAAGKYYWEAGYSGNAGSLSGGGNAASLSTCGSEVLTITPAATIGGTGTSTASSVTITVSCASTPCTVTITITIDPPSHGTRAVSAKKKKPKIVTIAKGTFKIKKKGNHKLTVKLTKAGKTLLKKDHGHLKPTVLLSLKAHGHTVKTTRTVKIK